MLYLIIPALLTFSLCLTAKSGYFEIIDSTNGESVNGFQGVDRVNGGINSLKGINNLNGLNALNGPNGVISFDAQRIRVLSGDQNLYIDDQPRTSEALMKITMETRQGFFRSDFLHDNKAYFDKASSYLGGREASHNLSFSMYQQWLYFEVYKAYRLEYLMMSLVKVLVLDEDLSGKQALAIYDWYLPSEYFENFITLKDKHLVLRNKLVEFFDQPDETQRRSRDFVRGSIEFIYLLFAMIDKKEEYLKERYSENDEYYRKEIETLVVWRQMIRNSSSIINMPVFRSDVEPYYEEEVRDAYDMQEIAINAFHDQFSQFITKRRNLNQLADFFIGEEVNNLGKAFAQSLQLKSQNRFRQRIKTVFPVAVKGIIAELKQTLLIYKNKFHEYNLKERIVKANTRPKLDNSGFHVWLEDIFREQVIHWIITEDYPHLQKGVEILTGFINEELRRQSRQRIMYYSAMAGLLSFSPAFQPGKITQWLGTGVRHLRRGMIIGGTFLSGTFFYDAYGQYLKWRSIQRLSRLNVEGMGLTTMIQEQEARTGFWLYSFQAGMASSMFLYTAFDGKKIFASSKDKGWWMNIVRKTWSGEAPLTMDKVGATIRAEIDSLRGAINKRTTSGTLTSLNTIRKQVLGVLTQFVIMVPAGLPASLKGVLNSIPVRVYDGVILGAVMGIMSVTVQHYINAMGIQLFVSSFNKLGLKPPTYWQVNALNKEFTTQRDAFVHFKGDLIYVRMEIVKMVGLIAIWKRMLRQKGLTAIEKLDLESAVKGGEETIGNLLFKELANWYYQIEYRDIYNSSLKTVGFGLHAVPSIDDPVRMTIFIKIGGKKYAYQTTAQRLDHIKTRKIIPDSDIEQIVLFPE